MKNFYKKLLRFAQPFDGFVPKFISLSIWIAAAFTTVKFVQDPMKIFACGAFAECVTRIIELALKKDDEDED